MDVTKRAVYSWLTSGRVWISIIVIWSPSTSCSWHCNHLYHSTKPHDNKTTAAQLVFTRIAGPGMHGCIWDICKLLPTIPTKRKLLLCDNTIIIWFAWMNARVVVKCDPTHWTGKSLADKSCEYKVLLAPFRDLHLWN